MGHTAGKLQIGSRSPRIQLPHSATTAHFENAEGFEVNTIWLGLSLLGQYAEAVDTVDLRLLAQIWSHSPDVSFIYPLGEEHGFDAIEQHVFQNVMRAMFSARNLEMHNVMIYVNGDSAWSEFHWDFHATMRKDGPAVTMHGVETQIYRKEEGEWHIIHVHYSEDPEPSP